VTTPAALKVDEGRYLLLGAMDATGTVATVAGAPIGELTLTRQRMPTPGASIMIDFGDSQWLVDFFWPQVVASSTDQVGELASW
jgi:hypothetical protein